MFFLIGKKYFREELFLANVFKDSGRNDRYYLIEWAKQVRNSHIYTPLDRVDSLSGPKAAGYIILEWMNEAGRTAEEICAARSFIGLDITELTANQKLFVADAEEAGVTINYNYFAPDSFGRKCPAIYVRDINYKYFSTNAQTDFEYRDNRVIVFAQE